jgi:Tol biopolymer transport system component
LIEGVHGADWSPDGRSLAVAREVDGKYRLESPIGKVLYETTDTLGALRFSPDGNRVAFSAQRAEEGSRYSVEVVDLGGKHSVLSRGWKRATGLAWSADGREVWFTASKGGRPRVLHAVTEMGKIRVLLRLPSIIALQDVARDGRVLASLVDGRTSIRAVVNGESRERDLSWHEGSYAKDLTPDGKTLLFDEAEEGEFRAIYIRSTDGSPAKLIGDGRSMAISPDGRWVASNASGRGSEVVLLPTGAGEPRVVDTEGHRFAEAKFFPDGKRILLLEDRGPAYVKDLPAGKLHAVAPEATGCKPISPDGKEVACYKPQGGGFIYAINGGSNRPIPGFQDGDGLMQWSPDGRALFVGRFEEVPMKIFRLDLATGRRELWREFTPLNPLLYYFAMTPDGKSYAYSSNYSWADLYLVTGVQ